MLEYAALYTDPPIAPVTAPVTTAAPNVPPVRPRADTTAGAAIPPVAATTTVDAVIAIPVIATFFQSTFFTKLTVAFLIRLDVVQNLW